MEPKLKYSTYADHTLLKEKDGYSCIVVDKLIAVGTFNGRILILDSLGTLVRELEGHLNAVNDLKLDDHCEYLVSGADDGNVKIWNLFSTESEISFNRSRPVKAVVLEPEYSKKSTKSVVNASTGVVKSSKGWLGYRDTVLYQGDKRIVSIEWKNDVIVWAGEVTICSNDLSEARVIKAPLPLFLFSFFLFFFFLLFSFFSKIYRASTFMIRAHKPSLVI